MFTLAGIDFVLVGELTPAEEVFLKAINAIRSEGRQPAEPFTIEFISERPPYSVDLFMGEGPPHISWCGESLQLSNSWMFAEVNARASSGRLFRRRDDSVALYHAVRGVLASGMPLRNRIPLHAAATVMEQKAVVFVGPSGAGKTTISSLSPFPLLSDELVVLHGGKPTTASASGFWGGMAGSTAPQGEFPVAAIIELKQGPHYEIARIDASSAMRLLTKVISVPPAKHLWEKVLSVASRVAHEVPFFSMHWALSDPPWDRLQRLINEQ